MTKCIIGLSRIIIEIWSQVCKVDEESPASIWSQSRESVSIHREIKSSKSMDKPSWTYIQTGQSFCSHLLKGKKRFLRIKVKGIIKKIQTSQSFVQKNRLASPEGSIFHWETYLSLFHSHVFQLVHNQEGSIFNLEMTLSPSWSLFLSLNETMSRNSKIKPLFQIATETWGIAYHLVDPSMGWPRAPYIPGLISL